MYHFLVIALFSFSLVASPEHRHDSLCQLVPDHAYVDTDKSRFNNGYKEERYHQVLDTFIATFAPDIEKRGGEFLILRDWSDGAVNAWAWRIGNEYWIEAPGGLSRYHLINEEGFLTTLCHELGHLLGGAPARGQISYEGQADYFSTSGCLKRILKRLNKEYEDANQMRGISSLTSYYAELAGVPAPTIDTPDNSVVSQTLTRHPKPQCRFDTMVAALQTEERPACWFASQNP